MATQGARSLGVRTHRRRASDGDSDDDAHLRERMAWLIRLRWIAIASIIAVIAVTWRVGLTPSPRALLFIALGMGVYNGALARHATQGSDSDPTSLIFLQILLDVAALTSLLHLSGGAENPFWSLYLFHAAIAGMLLGPSRAAIVASAASLLFAAMVLGEQSGLLAHHHLGGVAPGGHLPLDGSSLGASWRTPGTLVAFVLVMFGTTYFVHSIAARRRQAEADRRETERVALSRERLAHMGQISAGVAHSIRNPLYGVLNGLDLLRRRQPPDDATAEVLSLMGEGLHRIQAIVARLLDLTRDVPLSQSDEDVSDLVHEAAEFMKPQASRAEVHLEVKTNGHSMRAWVDSRRLSEAFLDVLDNAVAACSPGDTISVVVCPRETVPGRVVVDVIDSGTGIAEKDLPRVFDPFFTTKPVGEGTGLGLAMVERIMEELGGEVLVQSEVNKGTRVRFVLCLPPGPETRP